ncbi:MAG: MMPL family transporter, partial [Clostridia bacterium]
AASSLTTIAGMVALMFMQLRLGRDVGIVMSKGIIISLLTVFLLMPAILIRFANAIKKTKHRRFLPDIKTFSKIVVKLKYVLPVFFIILVAVFGVMQGTAKYAYSTNAVDTEVISKEKADLMAVENTFGKNTTLAILLPKTDYLTERKVLQEIEAKPLVKSVTGVANIKLNADTYLSDSVTAKEFSKILQLDSQMAQTLFIGYGMMQKDYQVLVNIDNYKVPLVDMLFFLVEQSEKGALPIEGEQAEMLDEMGGMFKDLKSQLIGENYNRAMFIVGSGEESDETFELIREIRSDLKKYYGDGAILVGEATNSFEMNESFSMDTLLITVLTIVLIGAILIFTFNSFLTPILLILIIQGSVWINFGIPAIMGDKMFFFAYLLGSAIQMGATIDYAIVITSRFNALKTTHSTKEAATLALQESFPTVATSGSIMVFATLLLGVLSTDPMIGSVGLCLSRGSLVSILSVMIILPELLIVFDKLNDKTKFVLFEKRKQKRSSKQLISGGTKINGKFNGYLDGLFQGKLNGVMISKKELEAMNIDLDDDSDGDDAYEDYDDDVEGDTRQEYYSNLEDMAKSDDDLDKSEEEAK